MACLIVSQQRQWLLVQVDDNKDSALHLAAIAGRALIVRELLERGALALEKNRDLMSPLQLACVDEAQGNGEVIRLLVEFGAPVDAKCWDTTPLQAAAASGHYWAVQVLLELGADVNLINGSCMGALDYARDQHTAQLLLDYMEGRLLRDVAQEPATWNRAQPARFGANGKRMPGTEDAEPRAFQSVRSMSLEAAMAHLGLPEEWVEPFRQSGEHFAEIRRAWRRQALASHPDKLSSSAEEDVKRKASCDFASAMAAFEAIDAYNAKFTGT
uniref:J domain-containing protein n=1 Tax=Chrysotila carterae TaxID=13221 RepID=A0A7S4B3E1_CHRCT